MNRRPVMDREAAEEYSQSLGQIGAGWWRQIAWADTQGIPIALGLTTREWAEQYVGGHMRMAIPDRRAAVLELTEQGMSQRAVADVLGVAHGTVERDLAPDAPNGAEAASLTLLPPMPDAPNGAERQSDAPPGLDTSVLVAHITGLSDLRKSLTPDVIAAGLRVSNRHAFAGRLHATSRYLEAVAKRLEEIQ